MILITIVMGLTTPIAPSDELKSAIARDGVSRSLASTCSMLSDTLVHSLVLVLAYSSTLTQRHGTGD